MVKVEVRFRREHLGTCSGGPSPRSHPLSSTRRRSKKPRPLRLEAHKQPGPRRAARPTGCRGRAPLCGKSYPDGPGRIGDRLPQPDLRVSADRLLSLSSDAFDRLLLPNTPTRRRCFLDHRTRGGHTGRGCCRADCPAYDGANGPADDCTGRDARRGAGSLSFSLARGQAEARQANQENGPHHGSSAVS